MSLDSEITFGGIQYGLSSHSLLQGIFPAQGSNLGLLHCRQILYHMIHQEDPNLKRYMHPNVHCSNIYNSQDMEATEMYISTGMDK